MTPKKTKILNELGSAYVHPEKGPRHTLMCFGYPDDGWFEILKELFVQLNTMELPKDFEIIQVKEKFAGLRVYTNGVSDKVDKLIESACQKASTTCEMCGEPGREQQVNGWYKTLCEKCLKIRKERRTWKIQKS